MLEKLIKNILALFYNIFKRSLEFITNFLKITYETLKTLTFTNTKKGFKETFKTIFYAFILALLIRSFLFEPFHIPSSSMKPNLLVGDFIFVSKYTYGYSRYSFPFGLPIFRGRTYGLKPKVGDIIVFRLPKNPKINYIKRLVGLPNDRIQIKKGVLYVNGKRVPKKYLSRYHDNTSDNNSKIYLETLPNGKRYTTLDKKVNGNGDNTSVFIVPKGYYFFMGDNRDNSLDSRFAEGAGFVPAENLVGKAQIIFFSSRENPLKFWKWFSIIRGKRIFKKIR